jgi:hypothetical protein
MRRFTRLILVLMLVLATASPAMAAPPDTATQPDNGAISSQRNPNAVAGGPHCHVVSANIGQGHFDFISVYPSHTAHMATGLPNTVFTGDGDCDGIVPLP